MPTYKYVAFDIQRKKYKGLYIAENEQDLATQLTSQGLYLVSSKVYNGGTPSAFFTLGTGKVSAKELTAFCRQFSIMISTGIPVLECIDSLKYQSYTVYFRSILNVISEDMKGGMMLSASFEKHKRVFPSFFVSMVRIGEVSGNLDRVFTSLADFYEFDGSMKRKAKSALAYPLLLCLMTLAIVILMFAFVVPTFKDALSSLDVPIAGYTKLIYDISDFMANYWQIIVVGIIVLGFLIFIFSLTKTGKKAFDIFKVKAPIIGKVSINLMAARFARAFYILLASGMDMASALDAVSIVFGNSYVESRFREAASDVKRGVTLTNALQKQNLFPQVLIQMISVGENTASLEDVFMRSCTFFDDQVDASLKSLISKIQPIMLLIMGLVVGSLFLAVYSPMLDMMTNLG